MTSRRRRQKWAVKHFFLHKAVVVAQLVERSLPTPEVRGLNPVIGKLLYWKDENKEKEAGNGPFKKTFLLAYNRAKWSTSLGYSERYIMIWLYLCRHKGRNHLAHLNAIDVSFKSLLLASPYLKETFNCDTNIIWPFSSRLCIVTVQRTAETVILSSYMKAILSL